MPCSASDHDRKLVGVHAIRSVRDEVADFALDDLHRFSLDPIDKTDRIAARSDTHCAWSASRPDAISASARIDAVRSPRGPGSVEPRRRILDLLARAAAPIA